MGCNSDYMEANGKEVSLSKVSCLIDELNGKKDIDKSHWDGYHPNIYNKHVSKAESDNLVAELCNRLQKADVSKYSLEMQMWWRDHQKADKDRLKNEIKKQKTEAEKNAALAKLTPYERELLDV